MAGGDFKLDFAAAAPWTYDHLVGGGSWDDKTIGRGLDVVESLQGGDFKSGELVSYFLEVDVDSSATETNQAIRVKVGFLASTTGQAGVGQDWIQNIQINYASERVTYGGDGTPRQRTGPGLFVSNPITSRTDVIDSANTSPRNDGGSYAVLVEQGFERRDGTRLLAGNNGNTGDPTTSTSLGPIASLADAYANVDAGGTHWLYDEQMARLYAVFDVYDLDPGEKPVVRIDVHLGDDGKKPTGNLQGFLLDAEVISPTTGTTTINAGRQTIPFKLTKDIGLESAGSSLTLEKYVTTDTAGYDALAVNTNQLATNSTAALNYFNANKNKEATVFTGDSVVYLYKITNTGSASAIDIYLYDDSNYNGSQLLPETFIPRPYGETNAPFLYRKVDGSGTNDPNEAALILNNPVDGNGNEIKVLETNSGGFDELLSTGTGQNKQFLMKFLQNGASDVGGDNGVNGSNDLAPGQSIIVAYKVQLSTYQQIVNNQAVATQAVDTNGGGRQGQLIAAVDTAAVTMLPLPNANTGGLSGFVYHDANNDGDKDAGEQGIGGVLMTLSNGTNTYTTRTNANGAYNFTNVVYATNYILTETQPGGFLDGADGKTGTGNGAFTNQPVTGNDTVNNIAINSTTVQRDYNFGEIRPASISGMAYYDLANLGVRDANETGRSGVTVTLKSPGADGTSGTADDVTVDSTTTDANGRYVFTGLRPGIYSVTGDGLESVGTGASTPGSTSTTSSAVTGIVLAQGNTAVNYDFGIPTNRGSISGTVYEDTGSLAGTGRDNGVIDSGEARIAGVTISLYDINFNLLRATQTDSNGNYAFNDLAPGTYRVVEAQPQYFDAFANNGQGLLVSYVDGKDSSPTGSTRFNDDTRSLVISGATTLTGNSFGELPPASVSGYVFIDSLRNTNYALSPGQSLVNADNSNSVLTTTTGGNASATTAAATVTVATRNGEFEDDEFGLAGVTFRLTGTNDLGQSVEAFTTSDANGYYRFDGLRPSNASGYTVTQLQRTDYFDGIYDLDGNRSFSRSEVLVGNILGIRTGTYADPVTQEGYQDNFSGIVLNFGQSAVDYNFPEATNNGLLTGKVYFDADNDGSFDAGELGIAGVTVTLSGGGLAAPIAVQTDANGNYLFSVAVGTYTVTETQPGNYDSGQQNTSNAINNVAVTAGTVNNAASNNFGEVASSISGFVRFDTSGNETGTDQSGLQGVGIELYRVVNGTLQFVRGARTLADGSYSFTGLTAGNYTVLEIDSGAYSDANPASTVPSGGSGTGQSNLNSGNNDRITNITLGNAANLVNYNFYETARPTFTLTKTVLDVLNDDNSQDTDDIIDTVGDKVVYQIQLVNTGSIAINGNNLTVNDPLISSNPLTTPSESGTANSTLDVGETWTYEFTHSVTLANLNTYGNTLTNLQAALPDTTQVLLNTASVNLYSLLGGVRDSYFDGYVYDPNLSSQTVLNDWRNFWCVDVDRAPQTNSPFTAKIYSTYESGIPTAFNVDKPENLDLVNWVLNQNYINTSAGGTLGTYTAGDVQRAIWMLIDDKVSTAGLAPWDGTGARAQKIYDAAIAFQGANPASATVYTPGYGDRLAVLAVPILSNGNFAVKQKVILEVAMPALGIQGALPNTATATVNANGIFTETATVNVPFEITSPAPTNPEKTFNPVTLTGTSGPNTLRGGDADGDRLDGLAAQDTLFGGLGNDTFIFRFGQSSVGAPDQIMDFAIGADKIDLLTSAGAAVAQPSAFSRAADSAGATLTDVVNSVFTDANGAVDGNQGLGINSAALVDVTTTGIAGAYLVINDGTTGFQAAADLVVNITGYSGALPGVGAITPISNWFV